MKKQTNNADQDKKYLQALKESDERFRSIVLWSPDAIIVTDAKGKIEYMNPAAEKVFNRKLESFVGKDFGLALLNGESTEIDIIRPGKDPGVGDMYVVETEWLGEKAHLITIRDITERKQAEDALRENEEKYRTILEDMDDVYFEVDIKGNITFVNPSSCRMSGYSEEELLGMPFKKISAPDGIEMVKQYFGEIFLRDKTGKPFLWSLVKKNGEQGFFELVASLIRDKQGKPIGFRGIGRDVTERKQAEAKLQQTLENLRKAFDATIQVMVSAVEMRDPYTAGHQVRVAELARAIATEMGLPQDKIEEIRMAGSIHDIGKLSIPAEILVKPTKLTDIEFSLIKEHSRSGYEMLKNVESPWPLAQIVYQHHERMNGSGYPKNLKGDEIILEARIMAVADVVEAMASHRPYRPSLGIDAALAEIEKNKGTIYDNNVADACLKLFREKGYQLT
jgi:PAS domain S-box-containing protein/putative nucleotidyltransferase with HDIG domain